jgi:multiple sugar transport system permease protein
MPGLAPFFALTLDSGRPAFARAFRLGIFRPYAVPTGVAALPWGHLYSPDFGPFAELAGKVGAAAPRFLSSEFPRTGDGSAVRAVLTDR